MILLNKTLFICRGLPSSGKTTAITSLSNALLKLTNRSIKVCSTDHFWTREDGEYGFDLSLLKTAHTWNQRRVEEAMLNQEKYIGVDNTNTTWQEIEPYASLAALNFYDICFIYPNTSWAFNVQECFQKSKEAHNVPLDTIYKMYQRFQTHEFIEAKWQTAISKLVI